MVSYKVVKQANLIQITLRTNGLEDKDIVLNQTISFDMLKKCGNLIDRNVLPGKVCYILLKAFQEAINKRLMETSMLIIDEHVKNDLIEYGKKIMTSEIEIVPVSLFEKMVKETQDLCNEI